MGIWTNKEHHTAFDDAEDLAGTPSGGCIKMWLLGAGLALIPLGYGVRCLFTGHACFFGSRAHLDIVGPAAVALAIAYIAIGVFIHAHYFLGLHPKLLPFSNILKTLAALAFIGSFFYTLFKIMA